MSDAARTQPNFVLQLVAAIVAVLLALALHVTLIAFVAVLILVLIVLALELVNTALEAQVDLASPEIQPMARRAKDAAAAAVLVAACGATIAGVALYVQAASAGYVAPPRPALDVQTVAATAALWSLLNLLAKAWLGARLRGLGGAVFTLLLGAGAACLCLLAHDPRML